ncbi:U-box domain-containing protein 17 [Linum grandiflorum]
MATAAIFSSIRRRRSPSLEAFLAPVDLNDVALLPTLATVAGELVNCFAGKSTFFQRRNSRSLIRKIEVFLVLLDYLNDSCNGSVSSLPSNAVVCLKELYLVLYRSKILLDYCVQSSKLWLLLQNQSIAGHFHDLNQEILTLLDVFPLREVKLSLDVREQIELIHRQSRRANLVIDKKDESLRLEFYSFLDRFEKGEELIPNESELRCFFVERLSIRDAKSCRDEIEFLEEQIVSHDGDVEPTSSVLNGFVAIVRYSRFLLFGFDAEELQVGNGSCRRRMKQRKRRGLITREIADTFATVPKDFCCPISLDLMRDPVIISTGQTYDRSSISRWMEEGHCSCPKTGQILSNTRLVPNKALRSLIQQFCNAHGIPYDPPENAASNIDAAELSNAALPSKAAVEANKATSAFLVQHLATGSQCAKTLAAREIRLLAKTGKESRAFIAEAGAIPHLRGLLSSQNPVAQENSVTAMLNLSIYDKNKSRIMDEDGCLGSIVEVLMFGLTTEAKENAAATLFSLSAVHDYKKRIANEGRAVEALAEMLRYGTPRGKKDAVTALFNLSTHAENCGRMIESGAVASLVAALGDDGVAEEAAGALALILRQPLGTEAVVREDDALTGLITMMRCGTPRGKENAVAALLELCKSGGVVITERVLKAPALAGLVHTLLFTGTKRARRKAASLARVFQRCENSANAALRFAASQVHNSESSFVGDVSVHMAISVPVL